MDTGCRNFALFLFFLIALTSQAIACPKEVGSNSAGYCLPVCDSCSTAATPDIEFAGTALEQAIAISHDQAINGAQAIPPYIRQRLTGYVDPELMNIVRYRVGDPGTASFALRLDISAITLVDLIIFKNADEACCDAGLWAHELFHVSQYRAWGTHAFAVQYVRDYRVIEDPAYAFQRAYPAWRNTQSQLTLPAGYGNFCLTGNVRHGPLSLKPMGSRCSWNTPDGITYGIIVE